MGGYIIRTYDDANAGQTATILNLQTRLNDVSEETAAGNARYIEIIRRLERIERQLDRPYTQPTASRPVNRPATRVSEAP